VLKTLRDNEPELQAAGIVHLRLHGSVARGQQTPASDVDLIADFDSKRRFSLIDMAHLQGRLENLLGVPVDLSPAPRRSRNRSGRGSNERRYLPFKNPSAPFRDIVARIEKTERFVAGIDRVAFREDEKQFLLGSRSCRKSARLRFALTNRPGNFVLGRPWLTCAAWEIGCGINTKGSTWKRSGPRSKEIWQIESQLCNLL
jgi:predicted nucleotidyltransferase